MIDQFRESSRATIQQATRKLTAMMRSSREFEFAIRKAAEHIGRASGSFTNANVSAQRVDNVLRVTKASHGLSESSRVHLRTQGSAIRPVNGNFLIDRVVSDELFEIENSGPDESLSLTIYYANSGPALTAAKTHAQTVNSSFSSLAETLSYAQSTTYQPCAPTNPLQLPFDMMQRQTLYRKASGVGRVHLLRQQLRHSIAYQHTQFFDKLRAHPSWQVHKFAVMAYETLKRLGFHEQVIGLLKQLADHGITEDATWEQYYAHFSDAVTSIVLDGYVPNIADPDVPVMTSAVADVVREIQSFDEKTKTIRAAITAEHPPVMERVPPSVFDFTVCFTETEGSSRSRPSLGASSISQQSQQSGSGGGCGGPAAYQHMVCSTPASNTVAWDFVRLHEVI